MDNQKTKKIFQGWKQIILKLEKKDFILVAAFLCLSIFGLGIWLGASSFDSGTSNKNVNNAERLKIAIPAIGGIVGTGLFLLFVNEYVQGNIEKHERQFKVKKLVSSEQVLNQLRENQDLDFLSHLHPKKRQEIQFEGFGDSIKVLRLKFSDNELEKKISGYHQDDKERQEALNGLSKGFTKDSPDSAPFFRLVVRVCNKAVGISKDDAPEALFPFYDNMHEYLKAWLFCSLKYGVPIPVRLEVQSSSVIIRDSSSGKEIHIDLNVEKYKEAIKNIQELVDALPRMREFFATSGARNQVNKYLDALALLLEEQISGTVTEDISEKSTGISS